MKKFALFTFTKQILSIITAVWVICTFAMFPMKIFFIEIDMMPVYTAVTSVFMASVVAYVTKSAYENKNKYNDGSGNSIMPEYEKDNYKG